MTEPFKRLDEAMNTRRLQLRMNWRQLAEAAGISYTALRAIRRGEYRPTELTARAVDEALRWMHGSVFAVLDGGDPTPIEAQAAEVYADRRATVREEQAKAEAASAAQPVLSSQELEILQDLVVSTASRLGLSPEETDEAYRRARAELERRAAEGQEESSPPPRRRRAG